MPAWDADLYLRYADERTQPSIDLVSRIAVPDAKRIIDLGCGPGNSTQVLRRRWPDAGVAGLDSSAEMIAAAKEAYPGGTWLLGDVRTWSADAPFDVAFSNATFQWVPDHAALFPRLFGMVVPGGALAVQMPIHLHSPLHRLMLEISERPPWREKLAGARVALKTEKAEFYYDLLQPLASRIDLWETEYLHVLDGPEAIVSWIRGTGLRPYLAALDDAEGRRFQELLLAGVEKAYPRRAGGKVLFGFRRLFVVAYRG
jgi:trans-aconitate 2-methyltransferase